MKDFEKALATEDYIFYCNFNECDDNANTKMYDKNGKLLSDNYFATNELMIEIDRIKNNEISYSFIHDYIKNYLEEF